MPRVMSGSRLAFEKRKFILKCYWKYENLREVQRQFAEHFSKEPPTLKTMTRIRGKFEDQGTVMDIHKKRSGRPRSSTGTVEEAAVLNTFRRSRRSAHETGISKDSVHRNLKIRSGGATSQDLCSTSMNTIRIEE
ncbi:hypothetical protein Q1695_000698 [Nippostrongylus brasiliensis]|nr:hypothetical protein Q1695_000698 [Nippostrongylus brasiliensis]